MRRMGRKLILDTALGRNMPVSICGQITAHLQQKILTGFSQGLDIAQIWRQRARLGKGCQPQAVLPSSPMKQDKAFQYKLSTTVMGQPPIISREALACCWCTKSIEKTTSFVEPIESMSLFYVSTVPCTLSHSVSRGLCQYLVQSIQTLVYLSIRLKPSSDQWLLALPQQLFVLLFLLQ